MGAHIKFAHPLLMAYKNTLSIGGEVLFSTKIGSILLVFKGENMQAIFAVSRQVKVCNAVNARLTSASGYISFLSLSTVTVAPVSGGIDLTSE